MLHPYQCLLYCSHPDQLEAGILLAASGPYIHSFNAQHGDYLSTWPSIQGHEHFNHARADGKTIKFDGSIMSADHDISEPPQKRRRVSSVREDSGSSAEIVVEGGNEDGESSQMKQFLNPPILKLACASTGQHVVAVTGEDKCIRVFELSADGILNMLSERLMPKRPCAIVLTADDSTILCADKFGDVYSLPLMGQKNESSVTNLDADDDSTSRNEQGPQVSFVPSATSLTVHTKGNREALRQQQKVTNPKPETRCLNFDHQLQLGHVSLLTDVACASVTFSSSKKRDYILTSDRDEHIRVSRGMPQAHIVEGYCHGHSKFVSKLCVPPSYPHLLISGGGDDYLLVWNWLSGSIRQKADLKGHVESFRKQYKNNSKSEELVIDPQEATSEEEITESRIAVTKILVVESPRTLSDRSRTKVIVICESVPALFLFSFGMNDMISFEGTVSLQGNVLDVVFVRHLDSIFYSLDAVHQPFSTTIVENDQMSNPKSPVGALNFKNEDWRKITGPSEKLVSALENCLENQPDVLQNGTAKGSSMRELLYSLENLRKRGSED